ncbi:MAG: decarboxylase [Leptolyngbyaceae cyanobacterium bins.302]|nr:decarboxylase [Leptolyngbyaceae cyanobacterium bins.302]
MIPPFPLSPALAAELLSQYGSPLYVYDRDRLQATLHHITTAFSYPHTHFHFASVTNGNLSLLKIFQQHGWGLHANTPGDIYLGLQAGFHPRQIVYSGSNLNQTEMTQVLAWGIRTLNLDSISQLELLCKIFTSPPSPLLPFSPTPSPQPLTPNSLHLGLRLNHPPLTGDSRIGVRPEEFSTAIALAQSVGLTISGLHFYRGTGTNATKAFTQVMDEVIDLAQHLPDWQYLDFGGGFGYPYHPDGAAFDWQEFGQQLSDRLHKLSRPIDLLIEPGRAAIAGCGTLLCQVVSVKWHDHKQIVGTDTTVANLSVPAVHGSYRKILPLHPFSPNLYSPTPTPHFPTDICGNTTYSRDYLGRNCHLPKLQPGDMLAVLDVGAYGYAMASHFLHRPRPAEVLLEHGSHRLIRQREDYNVLLANQIGENLGGLSVNTGDYGLD